MNKNHDVQATIIGEVSSQEHEKEFLRIKKLIATLKLSKKIVLIKNINNNKIQKFYYKNDFFVLPTNHDPAPYSILEAMSHGCQVLCSSSCGTKNYI